MTVMAIVNRVCVRAFLDRYVAAHRLPTVLHHRNVC